MLLISPRNCVFCVSPGTPTAFLSEPNPKRALQFLFASPAGLSPLFGGKTTTTFFAPDSAGFSPLELL